MKCAICGCDINAKGQDNVSPVCGCPVCEDCAEDMTPKDWQKIKELYESEDYE